MSQSLQQIKIWSSHPGQIPFLEFPSSQAKLVEPKEPIPVPSPCRARVFQQPLEACQPKKPNPIPSPLPDSVPRELASPRSRPQTRHLCQIPCLEFLSSPRKLASPRSRIQICHLWQIPCLEFLNSPRKLASPRSQTWSRHPCQILCPLSSPRKLASPRSHTQSADSEPRLPEQPEKAYEPKEPNPSLPMALSTDSAAKASARAEHDNQKEKPGTTHSR